MHWFGGTDMILLKIGVMVTNEPITDHLTYNHVCEHGKFNITTEVIWKQVQNYSLFNIAQAESSLKDDGAMSVFLIDDLSDNPAAVDWVIPLSGIDNQMGDEGANISEACFVFPDSVSFKAYFQKDGPSNPYDTTYSEILMSVLDKLNGITAILVYCDETEFIMRGAYDDLHTHTIFLSMYKIHDTYDNEEIYRLLHHVYHTSTIELSIIVVCGSKTTRRIMNEANNFDNKKMRTTALWYMSRWLMFNIDEDPLDNITVLSNLNNVAIIHLPQSTVTLDLPQYMTLQYVLDNFASEFGTIKDYLSAYCLNETSSSRMLQEIDDFIFETMAKYAESLRFPIKTLMFLKSGRQWSTVGQISISGEIYVDSAIFPNVHHGFNGKKLLVSTLEYHPFEYTLNGTWKGLCIDLLDELSNHLNFTYDIVEPADGDWGYLSNGTSWTGLIGQLQKREVDMTVGPLSIQSIRERVMDFTLAYFYDVSVILMKKSDPKETQWKRLVEPLRWEVIVMAGFLVPVVSIILFCMEKVNPFYKTNFKRNSLHDTFWYSYGCVFMQGGLKLPASQTGRTVVCCWWLFCIILSATYSGNLIAFLTVTKEKTPFDSLTEMVAQSDYEWGTLGGTFWVTFFERSSVPTHQSVWSGIQTFNRSDPRVLSKHTAPHIEKVKEGKYAYIAEKSLLEIIASRNCELHIAKEEFLPLQYGIGLPNESPFTKIFSDAILNIHETGLIQIWKQKHWPKRNFCAGSLIKEAKPIKWIDIQTAFYMIGTGTTFGMFVLLSECIFTKCRKIKKKWNSSFVNKVV